MYTNVVKFHTAIYFTISIIQLALFSMLYNDNKNTWEMMKWILCLLPKANFITWPKLVSLKFILNENLCKNFLFLWYIKFHHGPAINMHSFITSLTLYLLYFLHKCLSFFSWQGLNDAASLLSTLVIQEVCKGHMSTKHWTDITYYFIISLE